MLAAADAIEDWSAPTRNAGWSVADLVAHLLAMAADGAGGDPEQPPETWAPPEGLSPRDAYTARGVAARAGWTRERLCDALAVARDLHRAQVAELAGWDTPSAAIDRPTPGGDAQMGFTAWCFDTWVHLQDLRVAGGGTDEVVDASLPAVLAQRFVLDRVPWMFVKRAGAAEGASLRLVLAGPLPHDDVLQVAGGRAGWDATVDPGRCVIRAQSGAFALLASGRGTPEQWRERRLLEWDGPRGEDLVRRGRLFG